MCGAADFLAAASKGQVLTATAGRVCFSASELHRTQFREQLLHRLGPVRFRSGFADWLLLTSALQWLRADRFVMSSLYFLLAWQLLRELSVDDSGHGDVSKSSGCASHMLTGGNHFPEQRFELLWFPGVVKQN